MSDGFASLVYDYKFYDPHELVQAIARKGLASLIDEIRRIESEDINCLRYPRFKVSDDASALWLRVAN